MQTKVVFNNLQEIVWSWNLEKQCPSESFRERKADSEPDSESETDSEGSDAEISNVEFMSGDPEW